MRKLLSLILALVFILSIVEMPAFASPAPGEEDYMYYNVQDVFRWTGFEYDLKGDKTNVFQENGLLFQNAVAVPNYYDRMVTASTDADGIRTGLRSLKLTKTANSDNVLMYVLNTAMTQITGDYYTHLKKMNPSYSNASYNEIAMAAKYEKRFLLTGWVKPVENVSSAQMIMWVQKFKDNSSAVDPNNNVKIPLTTVDLSQATDWTNISATVDFEHVFNGNRDGYPLPPAFPDNSGDFTVLASTGGSTYNNGWRIYFGLQLNATNSESTATAYIDDYEIIEQMKTNIPRYGNMFADPGCENGFNAYVDQNGINTAVSGPSTEEKLSGNSSLKVVTNVNSGSLRVMNQYRPINLVRPYYYSFNVKASAVKPGMKLQLTYSTYALSNSNLTALMSKYTNWYPVAFDINSTEWLHFEGVLDNIIKTKDVYWDTVTSSYKTKDIATTNSNLRADDQFIYTNIYFTLTTTTSSDANGITLYFDDMELRELPIKNDGYENTTLSIGADRKSIIKSAGSFVLTDYYKNDALVYDGQVSAGDTVKVKSILIGNSSGNVTGIGIDTLFNQTDSKMTDVTVGPQYTFVQTTAQAAAKSTKSIYERTITIPSNFSGKLKTLFFDDFANIKPLSDTTELHIGSAE